MLALCLRYSRFFFTWVEFSQLMCLGHIWPSASIVVDFWSHKSGFLDSHVMCVFCLIYLPWWISLHAGRVFPTHISRAHLVLCLCYSRFLFTGIRFFLALSLKHIWLYTSVIVDFSSRGSGILNSHVLGKFGIMPLSYQLFFMRVRFSGLMHLGRIWPHASIVANISWHGSSF